MKKSQKKRRRLLFVGVVALFGAFVLGASELILSDSWVNGSGYISPNTSWSDNIKLNGTISGIYEHHQRLDGNGYNYINRSMNGNGTYVHYPRER
jgi:hypothetical protein